MWQPRPLPPMCGPGLITPLPRTVLNSGAASVGSRPWCPHGAWLPAGRPAALRTLLPSSRAAGPSGRICVGTPCFSRLHRPALSLRGLSVLRRPRSPRGPERRARESPSARPVNRGETWGPVGGQGARLPPLEGPVSARSGRSWPALLLSLLSPTLVPVHRARNLQHVTRPSVSVAGLPGAT